MHLIYTEKVQANYMSKKNNVQFKLILFIYFLIFFIMTNIKKIALATVSLLITTSAFAASVSTTTTGTTVNTAAATVTSTGAKAPSASLEIKSKPILVNKTSTGITLAWEKVPAAANYIVKYSKKSVANSTETNPQYDNETDPVTATGTTVDNLEPNTNYYFSVVAVDAENNESDTYSDELATKTDAATTIAATGAVAPVAATGAAQVSSLAITNVVAEDNKTISLEFSAALGTDPVTIKVMKISDNSDVPVSKVLPDPSSPNKVLATVATVLDPSSSYSITIISAKDTKGNNIQEGVNGVKEFQTAPTLAASPESDLNAASASGATLSGATASGSIVTPTALPATGTKENLIVIVALLLSFVIVYSYRRKLAK
jgi:hypothetical protein